MMEEQDVPSRRQCGAAAAYYLKVEERPEFREGQRQLEAATARRMAFGTAAISAEGPVNIPVVVHVVHNDESENISDAQIESQISVLNNDFRAQNPNRSKVPAIWEGLITDTNIQFALASEDPAGDTTTGITRTRTDRPAFGVDDSVKSPATGGVRAWPTDRYLNMWVCKLDGGLLGYAQFPGGPPETDGVVILNTAFGTNGTATAPFNGGQTATHEVGHFLNLYHIWGLYDDCTGGDMVADTPNAAGPNYGEPNFPSVSCNNGPNGDMFMNFMDYVNDSSMFMFTPQQVARMMATLEGPRSGLGRS
jgi:hypothetical protein